MEIALCSLTIMEGMQVKLVVTLTTAQSLVVVEARPLVEVVEAHLLPILRTPVLVHSVQEAPLGTSLEEEVGVIMAEEGAPIVGVGEEVTVSITILCFQKQNTVCVMYIDILCRFQLLQW